ncbi:MAG TPA: gluconokinase [Pyrinomonadaceae bacterium]
MPADAVETLKAPGEPPFVLALDVGSSSVRAAFFDSQGDEVEGTRARVERGFRTTADGGSELDAECALAEAASVIDDALALAPERVLAGTLAVAVACFWHSLVGVAADGRAVTPVYGWADTRAARQAEALRRELDERETHARTGCRLHPSYWPAKLRWICEERPHEWRAAARWMSFGELLTVRLCGGDVNGDGNVPAAVSMASGTGLLDQHNCAWDAALVERLGLTVEQMPSLARDSQTLTLANDYAARWPSLRGVPFFPAIADGAANSVGEGCATRARIALMVGTSAAMRVVYEGEPPAELHESLWCYRLDRRRVIVGGALSDGGALFDWLRDSLKFSLPNDVAAMDVATFGAKELEEEVARLEPDAHGLTILPFWSGERSTGWHARARGAVLGLGAHTRPAEIVRAAQESVAYRLALIFDALIAHAPGASLRASGGALLRSPAWARIIADVLGRPVTLSPVEEASSRGAVLLALEALGKIKDVADVDVPGGETIEHEAQRHAVYRRARERQQKFYDLLIREL